MLIPIGFLGAGGAVDNSMELIGTAYGTGSAWTVTFSSIPSTYKHLQLRVAARSAGNITNFNLTFNGSTTGYAWHYLMGNGSSVVSSNSTSTASIYMGSSISSSIATASAYSGAILDILDYGNVNKNKTTRLFSGQKDSSNGVNLGSGLWANTSAITSLTLTAQGTNYISTGSRFSLYGVLG